MPKLSIRHRTTYSYRFPGQLSPIVRCYVLVRAWNSCSTLTTSRFHWRAV